MISFFDRLIFPSLHLYNYRYIDYYNCYIIPVNDYFVFLYKFFNDFLFQCLNSREMIK